MVSLTLPEAVPLGYALVARVARDSGVRVLAIKGPILSDQGLRAHHTSVDVDVLVDPARHGALADDLTVLGWKRGTPSIAAHILPPHSVTLANPVWPCEIDLHDSFPGFLAAPQAVFEALWARRVEVPIAGFPVLTCDVVGNAAVAALHNLRDPSTRTHDLEELVEVLRGALNDDEIRDLQNLVGITGSQLTLAPVLQALGMPLPHDSDAERADLRAWRVRAAATGSASVPALFELTQAPWRSWPRLLLRTILLSEDEIRDGQPDASPGSVGLLRARLRRLRRGLKGLPGAVRVIWQSRGSDTSR